MDKAKKRQLKKYISWIALAALVAYLAVMPLLARQEQEADGPVASILSATAQKDSVEAALQGGGTLSAGNTMDITIPGNVKIQSFLVKNGETVTKGTPVAQVDKVSLMNAIVSIQDTLDYLQEQIQAAGNDTVSSSIRATAGGHIKAVYAQPGDSIQDVMIRHGALAVLSLDGRMAVNLQRDMPLAAGDTAWVTFSDGREVAARVESSLNGTIVVSLEDKGYAIGEPVIVTTDDGHRIGSGELYVHNAWSATGFTGTVQHVYAKENTDVYAGSTLFTLTDTDFTGSRDALATLHREYEELLQDLMTMYQTGLITAPCDGIVSGVDKNSAHLLAAGEDGWTVQLLSSTTPCTQNPEKGMCTASKHLEGCYYFCTGTKDCTASVHAPECYFYCSHTDDCDAPVHEHGCPHFCTHATGCPGKFHREGCPEICTNSKTCLASLGNHQQSCPQRCTDNAGCTATNHEPACPEVCTNDNTCKVTIFGNHEETCPERCQNKTGCIAQDDHLDTCPERPQGTFTGVVGVVNAVDPENKALQLSIVNKTSEVTLNNKTWDYGNLDIKKASGAVPDKNTVYYYQDGSFKNGDIVVIAYREDGTYVISNTGNSTLSGGMGGFGGFGGFGFGGFSFGGMGGTTGTGQELFSLDGDVLMTITGQDVMTLTITLDQQDIAKVSTGMTAVVEVAALKGQSFEAEITDIGNSGTNSGGSSKFTVELTLAMAEGMIPGMNATARIPLYTKMDAITIPVAALAETPEGTVVYTALDSETGEPASPVVVTTGVSDGEIVEILSGLNSGDTVYYSYYDTLELDHTAKQEYSFR